MSYQHPGIEILQLLGLVTVAGALTIGLLIGIYKVIKEVLNGKNN